MSSFASSASETVVLDPEKVQDAVNRCVDAMLIVNRFEATDTSRLILHPDATTVGGVPIMARVYGAGYVEDIIHEIKIALMGGEEPADAEAHED